MNDHPTLIIEGACFALGIGDVELARALRQCGEEIRRASLQPEFLVVFSAGYDLDDLPALTAWLQQEFPGVRSIGCHAAGTLCNGREFEGGPSLAIWGGCGPAWEIETFHLRFQRTSEGATFAGDHSLAELLGDGIGRRTLLAIGDPYTFPMDLFLDRVKDDYPTLAVAGGMASAASQPGESRLYYDGEAVNHGAVFALLPEQLVCQTAVSQGCRPIGNPMVVTAAERNEIFQLGGKSVYGQLAALFETLPTREQAQFASSLQIGIALNEYQEKFGYGDFLIRNVMEVDKQQDRMVVAEFVRVGQTIQFHIRDGASASADLRQVLQQASSALAPVKPQGALLFTCNGRGGNLFEDDDHDARLVAEVFGDIPVAGFFAAGEIGPVGDTNFLHGFTASLALVK